MSFANYGQKASSKGFTLIEMSIVLVIIGLIIGGILKGQEIVANSRAKAVVNQVNASRAAVNTYVDRYRALPGDHSTAQARVDARLADGDGDGVLDNAAIADGAAFGTVAANTAENYQYFKGLIAANLLNGGEVGAVGTVTSTVFGVGSSLPSAPVSGAGMTVAYGTHNGDTTAGTLKVGHFFRIHRNAGVPAAAFSPRELSTIDNQVDDGLPGAGGVRGAANAACYTAGAAAIYFLSDSVGCVGVFEAHP